MNYEPNNIMHYIFKQRRWSSSRIKLLNTSKNYKLNSQRHNLDIEEKSQFLKIHNHWHINHNIIIKGGLSRWKRTDLFKTTKHRYNLRIWTSTDSKWYIVYHIITYNFCIVYMWVLYPFKLKNLCVVWLRVI